MAVDKVFIIETLSLCRLLIEKEREKEEQTFLASRMDVAYVSARLFIKESWCLFAGEARDRKAHGRICICIACLPPKESPVSSFRYQSRALAWSDCRVISSRASDNGDKAAPAINHFYRAQGGESRLRTSVLFRGCEKPTFHREARSASDGINIHEKRRIDHSLHTDRSDRRNVI